jgi:carbon monoxide dehydrogenase subunit G
MPYACEPVTDEFVDSAPIRFVNSVLVHADPPDVWAALEDAAAWPRWAGVIKNVEWTAQRPFGVGTTRTVTMVGRMSADEEFIAWEPGRLMTFRFNSASMNGVAAFTERYTIETPVPGSSQVTWVMAMAPKGISKAIVPVTRWPMERAFGRMLRKFATLVEAEYLNASPGVEQGPATG